MENKKAAFIKGTISLLIALLAAVYICRMYFVAKNENDALTVKNKKLEQDISAAKKENAFLMENFKKLERKKDSLFSVLELNDKKYNEKALQYEKLKKDFKNLPIVVGDSIIREYIRANQ